MSFSLSSVASQIAALLNDAAQSIFTTSALLPYFKNVADELQLELELNGILVLEKISSTPVSVSIGSTTVTVPSDMLEPQRLEERLSGSSDLYAPMTRRQWEPDIQPSDSLRYWTYREQSLFTVGATTVREVKIYYLKRGITVSSTTSTVDINNAEQFMINRTAGLAARFIGENPTRADELDDDAAVALNKLIRIGVKSKQGTRTRRRPFRLLGRRRWV